MLSDLGRVLAGQLGDREEGDVEAATRLDGKLFDGQRLASVRHPRSDRPRRGVQPKLRYLERGRFEDLKVLPTIPVAPMTPIFKPDIRPFLLADEGTWQARHVGHQTRA